MKKNCVWIIEMFNKGKWVPTVGCKLTKSEALAVELCDWEYSNPDDIFRVAKYIPEE